MASGEIKSSLFAATDAADLTDAVADQIARDLLHRHRFPQGPAPRRPIHRRLRDVLRRGRAGAIGTRARRRVRERRQGLPGGLVPARRTARATTTRPTASRSRKRSCAPPSNSRASPPASPTARFHPVLQRWRAHTGVDYAAPTGTGVKATADGVVEFAELQKAATATSSILRHQQQYTTLYGHLSGFGRGVRTRRARLAGRRDRLRRHRPGSRPGRTCTTNSASTTCTWIRCTVAMPDAPPITPDQRAAFDAVARPLAHAPGPAARRPSSRRLD